MKPDHKKRLEALLHEAKMIIVEEAKTSIYPGERASLMITGRLVQLAEGLLQKLPWKLARQDLHSISMRLDEFQAGDYHYGEKD